MSTGDREWLPTDGEVETRSVTLSNEEWEELQGLGRVRFGDGTLLRMGEGRAFLAPAGTPPPLAPLPPAPLGTTVELRLFGMPYRWVTERGRLRLQRIETPPFYRELMRAALDLADANPAFRGAGG